METMNQSAVPRNQSLRPIYKEKLVADGNKQTFNLPGENNCLM